MKDQCILVTGATRGIGWALTRRLADAGAHVIGLARHVDHIDFPGYLYACDLANASETEDVLRLIREKYPVDAIVNNVGMVKPAELGAVELMDLYQVLDLNVRVALQVAQAFVESMKARRAGRIVNIASRAALGFKARSSYAAAKGALLSCTRTWAVELAPYGITVNAVSPGPVETELYRANVPVGSAAEQETLATIPMGRIAQPDEVAGAVLFLLGQDARYITGQELRVDGGGSLAGR